MTINEMTNLFVGYNEYEDMRIIICAFDKGEAMEVAIDYAMDTGLSYEPSDWTITEYEDATMDFNCDYVITGGQ